MNYRSERHFGLTNDTRQVLHLIERNPYKTETPYYWSDLFLACYVCAVLLGFVLAGPMVINFLRSFL